MNLADHRRLRRSWRLSPSEQEKLLLSVAGMVARERRARVAPVEAAYLRALEGG